MNEHNDVIEELLIEGLADWNYASWVEGLVADAGAVGPRAIRHAAIGAIAEALALGLVEPGLPDGKGGFDVWEGGVQDWLARISREWTLGLELTPGMIAWFQNTDAGNHAGQVTLDARSA